MEKKLSKIDWNFKNSNTDVLTSRIHPYHAKFIPQIPEKIIENTKSQKIIDPFVGSGTTTMIAGNKQIKSAGFDLNPLACLISKVKCRNYNTDKLKEEYNKLNINYKTNKIIDFPDKYKWYRKDVHQQMSGIYNAINKIENKKRRDFYKVVFSSIVNKVSKTPKRNSYIGDNMFPEDKNNNIKPTTKKYDVEKIFKNSLYNKIQLVDRLNEVTEPNIYNKDSKNISDICKKDFDLMITSPPYPNSVDYAKYHRLSFYWLGFELKETKENEIGARYKRGRKNAIEDYFKEVKKVYNEVYKVLKDNSNTFIVIGDSQKNKNRINNSQRTLNILEEIGFNHIQTMTRELSSQSTPSKSITEEKILHLKK